MYILVIDMFRSEVLIYHVKFNLFFNTMFVNKTNVDLEYLCLFFELHISGDLLYF